MAILIHDQGFLKIGENKLHDLHLLILDLQLVNYKSNPTQHEAPQGGVKHVG